MLIDPSGDERSTVVSQEEMIDCGLGCGEKKRAKVLEVRVRVLLARWLSNLLSRKENGHKAILTRA